MDGLGNTCAYLDLKNTQYVDGLKHYIGFYKYTQILSLRREVDRAKDNQTK